MSVFSSNMSYKTNIVISLISGCCTSAGAHVPGVQVVEGVQLLGALRPVLASQPPPQLIWQPRVHRPLHGGPAAARIRGCSTGHCHTSAAAASTLCPVVCCRSPGAAAAAAAGAPPPGCRCGRSSSAATSSTSQAIGTCMVRPLEGWCALQLPLPSECGRRQGGGERECDCRGPLPPAETAGCHPPGRRGRRLLVRAHDVDHNSVFSEAAAPPSHSLSAREGGPRWRWSLGPLGCGTVQGSTSRHGLPVTSCHCTIRPGRWVVG